MFSTFYASTVLQKLIDEPTFVSLFSEDPKADDSGAELSLGGYTRQLVSFELVVNPLDSVLLRNTTAIVFNSGTANLGVVTHYGLHDALTGGNLLFSDPLLPSGQWLQDVVFAFNAEQLQCEIATSLAFLTTKVSS